MSIYSKIHALVQADFLCVEQRLATIFHEDVALLQLINSYITSNGGKRLRPLLVLLAANICNYRDTHHIDLAVVAELLHTATLLHDDVVDGSELRRHQQAVHIKWNMRAAVAVGDCMLAKIFALLLQIDKPACLTAIAQIVRDMAEGELLQLQQQKNIYLTLNDYWQIILRKTAILFKLCLQFGAIIADETLEVQNILAAYGMHCGLAFQINDDILDYMGDESVLGKNVGDDVRDGKLTLPLIYLLQRNKKYLPLVQTTIQCPSAERIQELRHILLHHGALEYAQNCARQETQKALAYVAQLPERIQQQELLLELALELPMRNY